MATPRRIRRTVEARLARLKEIDQEVVKILGSIAAGPQGNNPKSQEGPIGIQSARTR